MMRIWRAPSEEWLSFAEELLIRIATLRDKTGFLLIPVENNEDAILWCVACFYSQVTAVPIAANLPPAMLEKIKSCFPRQRIYWAPTLPYESGPTRSLPPERSPNEIWAAIFTSGTSGDPKAVAFTGASLKKSARAHAKHLNFNVGTWLLNLPLYHIGGFSILSRAFFLNQSLALGPARFSLSNTLEWFSSGEVHGCSLVPTTLYRIVKKLSTPIKHNVRVALVGGAPLAEPLRTQAISIGIPVFRTYGMTETCSQMATEQLPGAGLTPLPGTELSVDANNIIHVKTNFMYSGFYKESVLVPADLKDGFMKTGDVGSWDGEILEIKGRASDLIISGGVNIFPQEVEDAAKDTPGVLDFAVTSTPSEEWGEALVGVVVAQSQDTFSPEKIRNNLMDRIDRKKVPKLWINVPEIPRSATGKVRRGELKKIVEKFALEGAPFIPYTEVDET